MTVRTNYLAGRRAPLTRAALEAYFAGYGFAALRQVLTRLSPEQVIDEVTASGLRGRGGAAFSAGKKWRAVRDQAEPVRYVVANGEEGEPGAFKDKYLLAHNPLALLEAMVICAYAVGAGRGYVYLNHNYRDIGAQLEELGERMRGHRLLGQNILDTALSFDIEVRRGRQLYVSGEETALFRALEGRRAEPTGRPPFPTEQGLWGKPTVINNVETFCNIPLLLGRGAAWYAAVGPEGSHGPKLFSVSGDVTRPGVYEAPMSVTLRELLDWAGGVTGVFKCAMMSGPSGTLFTASDLDKPLTIPNGVGNGAVIVCRKGRCAVDLARQATNFFYAEHCGQCLPGREGMKTVKFLLDGLEGHPDPDAVPRRYREIHHMLLATSKCGLCASGTGMAPQLMAAFPDDFRAHRRGRCASCAGHA